MEAVPPRADARHPTKKFSSLFLICASPFFLPRLRQGFGEQAKGKGNFFCGVLLSASKAAGLASIFAWTANFLTADFQLTLCVFQPRNQIQNRGQLQGYCLT